MVLSLVSGLAPLAVHVVTLPPEGGKSKAPRVARSNERKNALPLLQPLYSGKGLGYIGVMAQFDVHISIGSLTVELSSAAQYPDVMTDLCNRAGTMFAMAIIQAQTAGFNPLEDKAPRVECTHIPAGWIDEEEFDDEDED